VFVLILLAGGIVFGGIGFLIYLGNLTARAPERRKGPDPYYPLIEKMYTYTSKGWKNRITNASKTAGCGILVAICVYALCRILPVLFKVCVK